jgi:hypothetical protein
MGTSALPTDIAEVTAAIDALKSGDFTELPFAAPPE